MRVRCVCGALNEIPSLPKKRVRCGSCKHEFTPQNLAKATPSPKPVRPADDDEEEDDPEQD